MIVKAARKTGADPVAMLATALTENGARYGLTPGDHGTSYSAFQWHKGGALANHSPAWTLTQDAFDERASQFAKYGVHHGKGAAAVQRPGDPAGYALKVNSHEGEARNLLKLPGGGVASTQMTATAPQRPSQTLSGLEGTITPGATSAPQISVQGLMDSAKQALGMPTPKHPLLDLLHQDVAASAPPLKLPSGKPAKANPTTMDKNLPKSNSATVMAAEKFLGTPYLWGGTTAKGLDCSGLVQLAVKNATGKNIPRVASDQYHASVKVPTNQMKPGDIIAFGTLDNIHHIGIYVGNGQFINAPHTGAKVRIDTLAGRKDIVGAGRFPSN